MNQPANGKRGPKPVPEGKLSAAKITRGIGRYLDDMQIGKGNPGISLGALPGVKGWTTDPQEVQKAIAILEERAMREPSAIKRLRHQSRIVTLKEALVDLSRTDENGNAQTSKDFFIAHAAEFAAKNNIQYAAFRAMGVPPKVLKQAGILR